MLSSVLPVDPYGEPQSLLRFSRCRTVHSEALTILRRFYSPLHSPSDPRVPPALSYHLSEIWLTELDKVSASASASNTRKPVPLKLVLAPFLTLAAQTPNKMTYQQLQANLIDPLIGALSLPGPDEPLPGRSKAGGTCDDFPSLLTNSCLFPSDEPLDRGQLLKGLLEYVFEVASREDSKDSNRRKLYAICNANIDEDDDV